MDQLPNSNQKASDDIIYYRPPLVAIKKQELDKLFVEVDLSGAYKIDPATNIAEPKVPSITSLEFTRSGSEISLRHPEMGSVKVSGREVLLGGASIINKTLSAPSSGPIKRIRKRKAIGKKKGKPTPSMGFECPVCLERCLKKLELMLHMFQHDIANPQMYSCPETKCNFKTNDAMSFHNHLAMEHFKDESVERRVCPDCSKDPFVSESVMRVHRRDHHSEEFYKWKATLPSVSRLPYEKVRELVLSSVDKISVIKVEGEEKFTCTICLDVAKSPAAIIRHLLEHVKECVSCKICGAKCGRTDSLNTHRETIHGIKRLEINEDEESDLTEPPTKMSRVTPSSTSTSEDVTNYIETMLEPEDDSTSNCQSMPDPSNPVPEIDPPNECDNKVPSGHEMQALDTANGTICVEGDVTIPTDDVIGFYDCNGNFYALFDSHE